MAEKGRREAGRQAGKQLGFLCAVGGKLVVKFDLIYLIFWKSS